MILSAADEPKPDKATDTYIGVRDIETLSTQLVLD